MNLLLLLSAILSALTGVVGGAQRVASSPALEQCVQRCAAPASITAVAVRPLAAIATLVAVARLALPSRTIVAAAVPLWASRRRE